MTKNISIIAAVALLLSGIPRMVFAGTVDTKYDITFYDKIKADLSLDYSAVVTGDYGRWVASEATRKDVSAMNLTASETRFGINFTGPDYEHMVTKGNLENDFFDTSLEENKSQLYMRARNIGDAKNTTNLTNTIIDTGIDNASPIWEARAAITPPLLQATAADATRIQGSMIYLF